MFSFRSLIANMNVQITEQLITIALAISFFVGWYVGFQNPVFFNSKHEMDQRAAVSSVSPIGIDLSEMVKISRTLYHGHSPYSQGTYIYPPLVSILYLPLLRIPQDILYVLMSTFTVVSLFISLLIIDNVIGGRRFIPGIFLFFIVSSFFSYGMHFELERGQFNIITICLVTVAILFHYKDKRLLALLLLTVAVHLKLYPIIFFLLLFLDNLRSKKGLMINGVSLIVFVLLFFILGKTIAGDFFTMLLEQFRHPFVWSGNHSLFAYCSDKSGEMLCNVYTYPYFFAAYLMVVALGFVITFIKKNSFLNPYLFAICGLATCVIPSVSHDYKLSIIPIFLLPLFKELYDLSLEKKSISNLIALCVGTFFYTLLLFSTIFGNLPLTMNKDPILVSLTIFVVVIMTINVFLQPRVPSKMHKGSVKKQVLTRKI